MFKRLISMGIVLGSIVFGAKAQAEINVVTTDTNLAYIAVQVGGDRVKVESLSRGTDDPHAVDPKPSMAVKLAHAQVFARMGMDLDMWVNDAINKSGNSQIAPGGKGYADCSEGIKIQEIPPAKLDPSMGDIHVYGNPHYLMDPANAIRVAGNIAAALIRVDPAGQPVYHQRFMAFGNAIAQHLNGWKAQLARYKGTLVTTYHRTWVYFMTRFGLIEYGTIEPKPGVPPSPGHVNNLVAGMKQDKVRVMLVEDFRSHRFPDMISQQTGAKAVYVPLSVDGEAGVDTYFKLFDAIVGRLATALK